MLGLRRLVLKNLRTHGRARVPEKRLFGLIWRHLGRLFPDWLWTREHLLIINWKLNPLEPTMIFLFTLPKQIYSLVDITLHPLRFFLYSSHPSIPNPLKAIVNTSPLLNIFRHRVLLTGFELIPSHISLFILSQSLWVSLSFFYEFLVLSGFLQFSLLLQFPLL